MYEKLIDQAYETLLLRPADPGGRDYWLSRLTSGQAEWADLIRFLLSSAEFADRFNTFARAYVEPARLPLMNEFSQSGEVLRVVRDMVGAAVEHPIVVDVGAHGRSGSNSYDLMRHFGWRGVLLEPNPELAASIREDFAGLPFELVEAAASNRNGTAALHLGVDKEISSLLEEKTGFWGPIHGQVEVRVVRLAELLSSLGIPRRFGLLSIDAEGEDFNIINDALQAGFEPSWIITEAYKPAEITSLEAAGFPRALSYAYEIVDRTAANLILRRSHRR